MINKSTLVLVAATAAVSLASPEFAQSQERYGSPLPNYYDSSGTQKWGSWGPPEQGSTGSSQSRASANRTQSVERPRGHNAFGYAPERRSSNRPTRGKAPGSSPESRITR
jgi:hypothetical protein